ncbi:phosphoketolase family protein [Streptomyces jumonjinensis]|uniref:phosphoketolase family protein n=1 Tax=Streptomyces jumonjinensis TaxID=1945 RepID=UPI0037B5291A
MPDAALLADALWRATCYASVCQLHLRDNVLLRRRLTAQHVKERPSGHWGTVPGTAWALSHLALATRRLDDVDLVPLLGAGHAGVVQLSAAWVTGELGRVRPRFSLDAEGLRRLARDFPDVEGMGAEVHPALPAGAFLGGRIGGCLAFAQGAALDSPGRIVVPVVGDGECETPTTAASWLAQRLLPHAAVLPLVHVNGFRMGARSLLGAMDDDTLRSYFGGFGWEARVVHITGSLADHTAFGAALGNAVESTLDRRPTALVMRCVKGWSGPASLAGRDLLGTPELHKTPLSSPRTEPEHLTRLTRWLASYRPTDLFDEKGRPKGMLADAVAETRWGSFPAPVPIPRSTTVSGGRASTFADAVAGVVRKHAAHGDFLLMSPDELASNRLADLADEPWAHELLAEEVLLEWLAGWTASGRRGVLVSYEAFAPLLTSGLVGHIKQRRLVGAQGRPSLNLLLTSYGWHNVHTHGDPSLATALLALCAPAVRVLTPADPARAATVLDDAFDSFDHVNLVVAGKHSRTVHPAGPIAEEHQRGLAVWPHLSDEGEPDLTVITAGDIPAAVATEAVGHVRHRHRCRVRVVNLLDLTVLGDPSLWPRGLNTQEIDHYLGAHAPVLVLTLGHPAAVWGLLAGRLRRPVDVIGWHEPAGPLSQERLAQTLGMDRAGVARAAGLLLASREVVR